MKSLQVFYDTERAIYHSDQFGCKEPIDQTIHWLGASEPTAGPEASVSNSS